MESPHTPFTHPSPLRDDTDAELPAAAYLRYESRADGWSAGRQAAFLCHLADNGVVADAARSVGMSLQGGYALRRQARGYAFSLGWEAALLIARRIVVNNLMTAAVKGEQSRWVREEGVTTYTRQNSTLSLALLNRISPSATVPEVQAVAMRFDWFLQLIDDGARAEDLWEMFFDAALPHSDVEARDRVRGALLLCEEAAIFGAEDEGDAPIEVKSKNLGTRYRLSARAHPRPNRTSASSSACRNRERSAFVNGAGPPVMPSAPTRKSAMIARVAMALPIEAVVNGLPLPPITTAPALRQRSASKISAVITTLFGPACSAIQSSAASKLSLTTTRSTAA